MGITILEAFPDEADQIRKDVEFCRISIPICIESTREGRVMFGGFRASGIGSIATMRKRITELEKEIEQLQQQRSDSMKNEVFRLGPSADELNEVNKVHAIAYGGVTIALLKKGVLTQEEYDRGIAEATHIVDQEYAKKRDKAEKESDSKRDGMEAELQRLYPGALGEIMVRLFRDSTGGTGPDEATRKD